MKEPQGDECMHHNLIKFIFMAPHQPLSFHFPQHSFGNKHMVKREFNASWFDSHTWLHYDETRI